MTADELTGRLAELAVDFGANLQPGQLLFVQAEPAHAPLVRAVAAAAYQRGATFVDVVLLRPVGQARPDRSTPTRGHARVRAAVVRRAHPRARRAALRAASGSRAAVAPGLFDDLDPARAGRDLLPRLKETGTIVNDRTTNWTIVPYPTSAWATQVHPELDGEALAKLTDELAHVLRLDEPDPVAAWHTRFRDTNSRRRAPDGAALRRAALPRPRHRPHHRPASRARRWAAATFETVDGIEHMPNLPTEEVFTTPDPQRVDGHVTATKPLVFADGSVVRGLRVRFEGGRAVQIDADEGVENIRARVAKDEGGSFLGEVALVDREGRIGPLDVVFYDTLLDENAASHIALGQRLRLRRRRRGRQGPRQHERDPHRLHDRRRRRGRDRGHDETGTRCRVLRGGAWQI